MSEGAVITGFADPAGVVAGVCWRLGDEAGGALLAGDSVSAAEAELAEEGNGEVRAELTAGEASGRATLKETTGAAVEEAGEGLSCGVGEAEVAFELGGRKRSIVCPGHVLRWASDPREGAGLVRHLALPRGEGGYVIAAARRPSGAGAHDAEAVTAVHFGPDGLVEQFAESLVSTQYDEGGVQTRAGLELIAGEDQDGPPLRASGAAIGAVESGAVTAAILRTSAEGEPGIGSYLIWRA